MGTGVAVLDTGIYRHIDFGNRIIGFADMVAGRGYAYDDSGHGTHVAGIIAGDGTASRGKYVGVAPKSNIVAVKVLDRSGSGLIKNVIKGLKWIEDNRDRYDVRIINISFGTTSKNVRDEQDMIKMVEKLWDDGIIIVAAAGNSGPSNNSVTAPGSSKKIITVGAFDDSTMFKNSSKNIKYFSGRGPTSECIIKPEVVVAGANIVACSNKKDDYSVKSGTSMAAPVVTGAIARLLELEPELTPKEVKIRLKECCEKIKAPENQQGWGMLNIAKFVGRGHTV